MVLQFNDFGFPVEVEYVSFEQNQLIIGYYSKVEDKRYMLQTSVEKKEFIIGLAPYGGVAFWSTNKYKRSLLKWQNAEALLNQNDRNENTFSSQQDKFNNYAKQYYYRYQLIFVTWNGDEWKKYNEDWLKPELDIIEEMLYDGTYDKLHDGGLMKYHEAGKPKKLAIKWHINKSEYSAYFWFDEDGIKTIFDKFYGSHPDTKTDFIIRIDAENQKYELALYRYGLKEPQIIPEEVYQLIVFKNKFEDYRSDNYNQESGAWIW